MLNICTVVASELDLKFNIKKSMAPRIGSRYKRNCSNLLLDGKVLQFVPEIKYLGVFVQSGSYLRCSFNHTKIQFYRSFNAIFTKAKSGSSEIICINLLKAYCLPLLLYATEAISPGQREIKTLDKLIDRAFSKIFNSFDPNIISTMRAVFGLESLCSLVYARRSGFIASLLSKQLYFVKCLHSCSSYK